MQSECLDDYIIHFKIGKGGFSDVYYAIHKATGLPVAIKKIPKVIDNSSSHLVFVKREIEIMQRIPHPFISDFYEVVEDEHFVYIVMEYVSHGTLRNTLNEVGPFTEDNASIIFAQIVLVLKHLQFTCNVAHRDLKSDNILFDKNGNIRVIDFGLSNSTSSSALLHTQCGTPSYASPEMILGEHYSFSSDIWSSGVVLYEMVTGHLPFEDDNLSRLAQKIVFKEVEYPSHLSSNLIDLLQKLLTKDQKERITISNIILHPWIKRQIKYVEDKLTSFSYDKQQIKNKLIALGLTIDSIDARLMSVSYNLLKRNYLTSNFDPLHVEPGSISQRKPDTLKISILPKLGCKSKGGIVKGNTSRCKANYALILKSRKHVQPQMIQI